ncbi:peptidase family m48 [Phaffia rhodozyma]|uniref:Peptidase family m48 n=1 Tax=Phaffia rhodozyma TaxID=264483 RepID=A0A0F7SPC1_PHARH|nr:peptidase family m48 [Phaffia rhodozyma]
MKPVNISRRSLNSLPRPISTTNCGKVLVSRAAYIRSTHTSSASNAQYNRFPTNPNLPGRIQKQPPILSPFQTEVLSLPPNKPGDDGNHQQRNRRGGGGGAGDYWQSLDGRTKLGLVGLAGAGGYYVFHLERAPHSGRLRFIDVSPASEKQAGLQSFQEMMSEYASKLLPENHRTTQYVRMVAANIVESNGLGKMKGAKSVAGTNRGTGWDTGEAESWKESQQEEVEWEVFVINDKNTKNAFVLPGGKIFVFTGILPVCANEAGLASVLGHEIAHQTQRHSAERMSSLKVLFVLNIVLESLGLDIGVSRLLLTFLLSLPNSRTAESEADFVGLRLMSKACYDPTESPKMWERMSEMETGNKSSFGGAANIDFMSTHPANGKRIKNIEGWLPEALSLRAGSHCQQIDDFQSQMPGLIPGGRLSAWN